ncbi:flagellar basal body-associated FliL family protein [Parasphingorhabdus cellanae]|uniref:Flagellar protein FliL n=1 Tax=Parasphingorhabdus cellanae TaxID=2806553 RepID=A0ABX7T4M5_9SPHN|nr:flagellar basal body-associated FliL family protein [Parasphingorhabdus cellanae]QTD56476.1 flagellar basal body-associated FliL family protein [Parasphingorhabdus cellanae]
MADAIGKRLNNPAASGRFQKTILGTLFAILLGIGAMAAGYFMAIGGVAQRGNAKPELVSKGEGNIAMSLSDLKGDKRTPSFTESAFKATYYPIDGAFTSNLKNSNNFVQLSISIATYYDERVVENIKQHETAIRSTILMTLAEQEAAALSTHQGKEKLQGVLTNAINKMLKEKTGFGGINNVYFTSFVVQ